MKNKAKEIKQDHTVGNKNEPENKDIFYICPSHVVFPYILDIEDIPCILIHQSLLNYNGLNHDQVRMAFK